MSDKRIKTVIFAGVSMGVGLIASLLLFETALRVIDWPSPGLYQDGRGPLPLAIATEEGSSWRNYSGAARIRHWDYDVDVELNAHGFIERENAPKSDGVWRIGLFGDSFVAGMGVEPDQRFGRIWNRSLPDGSHPPLELYNFGSVWSGTGQNAAFLAREGGAYELDEIILAVFGGNELQDNERWEAYRALSAEQKAERDRADRGGRSWRDAIRNRSRAAGFLYVTLVRGFAKREALVPTREFVDEHWAPTQRALDDFAATVGDRPLTIWYLPSTTEWDEESWNEVKAETGLAESDRHSVRDRIRDWAQGEGIPFVDTTRYLQDQTAREIRFPRDGHWNALGHDRVGRALAAAPEASHWQRARDEPDADGRP